MRIVWRRILSFMPIGNESGYDSSNDLPEKTLVHITSREEAHFYVKLFLKFNINRSWLCKNYSFFSLMSRRVLHLPSGKCPDWFLHNNIFPHISNILYGIFAWIFFPSPLLLFPHHLSNSWLCDRCRIVECRSTQSPFFMLMLSKSCLFLNRKNNCRVTLFICWIQLPEGFFEIVFVMLM